MADNQFKLTPTQRKMLRGTWHHVPDVTRHGYGTLELVPGDLHNANGHYGGVEQYKKLASTNGKG